MSVRRIFITLYGLKTLHKLRDLYSKIEIVNYLSCKVETLSFFYFGDIFLIRNKKSYSVQIQIVRSELAPRIVTHKSLVN